MLLALALFAALAYPLAAAAAKIGITIGSVAYTPDTVTAAVGDIIEFSFFPVNNTATMSDFDAPCIPAKTGGFHSGFFATESGQNKTAFQIVINSTDPIFFYCGLPSHCQKGMAGVINPGKGQTLEAYRRAAASVKDTVVPDSVFGGQLVASSGTAPPPPASKPSGSTGNGAARIGVSVAGAFVAAAMML